MTPAPDTALVMASFGSGGRARVALDIVRQALARHVPSSATFWCCTSRSLAKTTDLPGVDETLAQVEAQAGFTRALVQPLHVFPGSEYDQLAALCGGRSGLRVTLGETLLHRREYVRQALAVVERDFLPPDQGCNLLALHGCRLREHPVNDIYREVARLVADLYPNVLAATIEGVPDFPAVLAAMARRGLAARQRRVRLLPFMFFAGMHAERDLMGGQGSWREALVQQGCLVDCPTVEREGETLFKGLAHYPEIVEALCVRVCHALTGGEGH